jgi:hypothetical protein
LIVNEIVNQSQLWGGQAPPNRSEISGISVSAQNVACEHLAD